MRAERRAPLLAPLLALLLAGCAATGAQDALNPKGPQAERIAAWFWLSFGLAVAVFVLFVAVLGYGLARAHRRQLRGESNELPERHGRALVLWGGLLVPLAILFTLLVTSAYTDRRLNRLGGRNAGELLTIQVVAHQFWWEVTYVDRARPYREFTTANEIHVPAGRPVNLTLQSRDVIHSFWVPNLHGKMDLIPGRTNTLVLQADEPGVYRGQCAEFCGIQHAKMSMLMVAHDSAGFEAWREGQLRPHAAPTDTLLYRGQAVFMRNGCGVCHAIRGTPARGSAAPDLSHLASRRTIAAGTLPNTRGHLAGWISDPQAQKPGNFMPRVPLRGDELQALLGYLLSLK